MAPRLPVDSGLRPVRLRPQASPVNTFVQPTEGHELAQLAQGLQQFAPSLGRFASVLDERDAQEQLAKGTQRARQAQEERLAYQDAIKKGLITAKDSKWFVMGFKQQYGRAAAGQYAVDLHAAIAADEKMQASTEPSDFAGFESEFRKSWLEKNVGDNRDLHFEKGFGIVDGYTMDEARRFTAAAGARMEKRAGDQLGLIMGQILDQHYKEGPEMAASLIEMEMRSYLFDNPKGGRVANRQAIESIARWARNNYKTVGRDEVEELLRKVKAGPGSNLFGLKEAKDMLTEVEKEILSMRGAAMNFEYAEEQREERKALDTFWSDTNTMMADAAKNGVLAGMDLTPLVTELNKINPGSNNAGQLHELRQSLLNAKGNDAAVREGLMWVHGVAESRPGQFLSMRGAASYAQAEGLSAAQFNTLVTEIQQRDLVRAQGAGSGSKLLGDNMVDAGRSFIATQLSRPEFAMDLASMNIAKGNAIRDFNMAVLNDPKLAELSGPERMKRIQEQAELAVRINSPDDQVQLSDEAKDLARKNTAEVSPYLRATQNAPEADLQAIGKAFLEYQALSAGTRPDFSPEAKALLTRLGVPITPEDIKAFFLEWDRNQ